MHNVRKERSGSYVCHVRSLGGSHTTEKIVDTTNQKHVKEISSDRCTF